MKRRGVLKQALRTIRDHVGAILVCDWGGSRILLVGTGVPHSRLIALNAFIELKAVPRVYYTPHYVALVQRLGDLMPFDRHIDGFGTHVRATVADVERLLADFDLETGLRRPLLAA